MSKTEITKLATSEIKLNKSNPRLIKDDKFKKLVNSIKEFPEMLEIRPIVVNTEYVILGGNMRFRAAKEAGYTELPVRIVDWSEDKQRQFIIKDNLAGGEWDWDILANEWDGNLLDNWGIELPSDWDIEADLNTDLNVDNNKPNDELFCAVIVAYNDINDLDKITNLYELDSIDITEDMRTQISNQRKVYVFKNQ